MLSLNFVHYIQADEKTSNTEVLYLYDNVPLDLATFYAEAASAIFFAITTGFLIFDYKNQNREELRQQREEVRQLQQMRDDAYSILRDHHHDLLRLLIEEPELFEVYNHVVRKDTNEKELNEKEIRIFNFYIAEFDLYERVRKYVNNPDFADVTEEEWISWLLYLEQISHHWLFRYTFEQTRTMFGEESMRLIDENIIAIQSTSQGYLNELMTIMSELTKDELKDKDELGLESEQVVNSIFQKFANRKANETELTCLGSLYLKIKNEKEVLARIEKYFLKK